MAKCGREDRRKTPKRVKNSNKGSKIRNTYNLRSSKPPTTMEKLPLEITTTILSRFLDFKTRCRCRCICKLWYSILLDPTLKPTPDLLVYCWKSSDCSEYNMYYVQDFDKTLEITPLLPNKDVDISFVRKHSARHFIRDEVAGSCNGFVCLIRDGAWNPIKDSIHVFNHITGQRFGLPPCDIFQHKPYGWHYGFGYDDSRREGKIVVVTSADVYVHTLGSNSWRRLSCKVPAYLHGDTEEVVSRAFVNGSFHWDSQGNVPIVSFNLASEDFVLVQPPNFQNKRLGVMEKKLAFVGLSDNNSQCFDIWVMNVYNVRESWVKLFTVERQRLHCHVFPKLIKGWDSREEVLLLCGNSFRLISYNTVGGMVRCVRSGRSWWNVQAHPFAGSISSANEAFGINDATNTTT